MNVQRVAAVAALVLLGMAGLPVVASVLDAQGRESWILPVHLLLMALVGMAAGRVVPGLAGKGSAPRRSMAVGALVGLGAAVLGLVVFFVLLGSLSGA